MVCKESYELGKQAYLRGKPRDPLKDHVFEASIQTKGSAEYHPTSPGAEMSSAQRRRLEEQLCCWKDGWDDAHKEDK